jgi:hypothetical protein
VPTREVANLRDALRPLTTLHGSALSTALGVRQMKSLRVRLIETGLARYRLDGRVNWIVRVFR